MLEAVVAIVLLSMAVVLLVPVFDAALRYQQRAEQELLATTVAASYLSQIEAYAGRDRPGPGFGFDDLASLYAPPGVSAADPLHPEFTVRVQSFAQVLYSPCSTFETLYSGADIRKLTRS